MLSILYVIAITAEAMTGALAAGRREMDWIGMCMLACVTALGGGSMRDILLGHYPLSWVQHPQYLWITAGAALVTALIAPVMRHLRRLFLLLDALGLAVFSVIGCQVALSMNLPVTVVLVSGMITGCAGGVWRDVLCNDIPLLFRRELYASVSLATGGLYLAARHVQTPEHWAMLLAVVFGLLFRLLALWRNWQMPRFVYRDDWD